jgi:hypothetical protein
MHENDLLVLGELSQALNHLFRQELHSQKVKGSAQVYHRSIMSRIKLLKR